MLRLERILCPVDFSEPARRALQHAGAIARWYRARLSVVHVLPTFVPPTGGLTPVAPDPLPGLILLDPARREPLERNLDELVAPLRSGGAEVRVELVEGAVVDQVLERASAVDADLIVIGTEGAGGVKRLLLGSVAEPVLERAPCPVLTVGLPAGGRPADEPVLFRRIVCGIDFSQTSLRALEYALSLAQEAEARVTLLHAGDDGGRGALERLERLRPADSADWAHVELQVATGRAADAILRAATDLSADLAVVGAHGQKSALGRLGSTTHQIVRAAPCPVLTVRG